MNGIVKSDGGFAEYMIASCYSLVHLPDDVSFEQAAPLMCAGVSSCPLPWFFIYLFCFVY